MIDQAFLRHLTASNNLIASSIAQRANLFAVQSEANRLSEYNIVLGKQKISEKLAFRRMTYALIATLHIAGIKYKWLSRGTDHWCEQTRNGYEEGQFACGIYWRYEGRERTIIYNTTIPLIKIKVDLCLFNSTPNNLDPTNSKTYLALGELKGGIGPAGADEQWKSAKTALERIRKSFAKAKLKPHTFFIGAAIERKMANEIWNELQEQELSNAANLNEDDQLASISHWLCNL